MIISKYLLWSYVVHIFADCKVLNTPVLAQLCEYSHQVLIKSWNSPSPSQ